MPFQNLCYIFCVETVRKLYIYNVIYALQRNTYEVYIHTEPIQYIIYEQTKQKIQYFIKTKTNRLKYYTSVHKKTDKINVLPVTI